MEPVKKLLSLQIIELLLFVILVVNQKRHYLNNDFDIAIRLAILVCFFMSIALLVKMLRNIK